MYRHMHNDHKIVLTSLPTKHHTDCYSSHSFGSERLEQNMHVKAYPNLFIQSTMHGERQMLSLTPGCVILICSCCQPICFLRGQLFAGKASNWQLNKLVCYITMYSSIARSVVWEEGIKPYSICQIAFSFTMLPDRVSPRKWRNRAKSE